METAQCQAALGRGLIQNGCFGSHPPVSGILEPKWHMLNVWKCGVFAGVSNYVHMVYTYAVHVLAPYF